MKANKSVRGVNKMRVKEADLHNPAICPVCGAEAVWPLICDHCGREVYFCFDHYLSEAKIKL